MSPAVWERGAYYALGVGDYGNTSASLRTLCHRDTTKQMLWCDSALVAADT